MKNLEQQDKSLANELQEELAKKKIDISDLTESEDSTPTSYAESSGYSRVVFDPPSWLKGSQ